MTVLTVASAIHAVAALRDVVALHASGLASGVPNPAPKAPPGLTGPINTLLAWWKWGALVAGVFGLIGCGAMMAIGRRNRSSSTMFCSMLMATQAPPPLKMTHTGRQPLSAQAPACAPKDCPACAQH
jgi:hypothetical protein